VIDEYELVAPHPGPARVVERFVASSGARVLITGRERPEWLTPRDMLYGDAFELRAAALSMTLEEASQVLSHAAHRSAGLVALADGWPAVIGLAALMPREVYPTSHAPPALFDYIAQELFDELAPDVQRHLVLLSIPATLTPTLVKAVVGDDAERVLRDSTRVGVLSARDANEVEIHPLCRTFLEQKLWDVGVSREQIDRLTLSLIDGEQWDDVFEAIRAFGLEERLPLLIERGLRRVLGEGRSAAVERWVSWADEQRVSAPELALAQAEIFFRRGAWALSESLASTAALSVSSSSLRAQAHLCAGTAAHLQDEVDRAWDHYGQALASDGPPDIRRRALWGRLVASYWTKRPDYRRALTELRQEVDPSPEHLLRLRQAGVVVALREGGLTDAVDPAVAAEPLLAHIEDPFVRSSFMNTMTYALGAAAKYAQADLFASRHVEEATRFHLAFAVPTALANQAMAKLGLGLYTAASALLERSEHEDVTNDPFLAVERSIVRAYISLSRRRSQDAVELLHALDLENARSDIAGEAIATCAFAQACCGETSRATQSINAARTLVHDVKGQVMLSCSHAVLALDEGPSRYRQQLTELAVTVEQTGCFDGAVCAMRASPRLMDAATTHPELKRIIAIAATRSGDPALTVAAGGRPDGKKSGEVLSNREREVLKLAAEGFRNDEIGERLFISPKTVKTHLQNIYEKLDVGSRTEAAMKAKESGLLR
jgi:ATP/maltotriose-dependent transcriptional regulator MalT